MGHGIHGAGSTPGLCRVTTRGGTLPAAKTGVTRRIAPQVGRRCMPPEAFAHANSKAEGELGAWTGSCCCDEHGTSCRLRFGAGRSPARPGTSRARAPRTRGTTHARGGVGRCRTGRGKCLRPHGLRAKRPKCHGGLPLLECGLLDEGLGRRAAEVSGEPDRGGRKDGRPARGPREPLHARTTERTAE